MFDIQNDVECSLGQPNYTNQCRFDLDVLNMSIFLVALTFDPSYKEDLIRSNVMVWDYHHFPLKIYRPESKQ